jgi:hypothetical protein
MTHRVKVYHPETDEMFEVTKAVSEHLILNEGWRQHPLDPNATPAVQTVNTPDFDLRTGDEDEDDFLDSDEEEEG